jgi:hypothetical protein
MLLVSEDRDWLLHAVLEPVVLRLAADEDWLVWYDVRAILGLRANAVPEELSGIMQELHGRHLGHPLPRLDDGHDVRRRRATACMSQLAMARMMGIGQRLRVDRSDGRGDCGAVSSSW